MGYNIVRFLWNITKWITGVVLAFFIGYVANIAVTQIKDLPTTSLVIFVNWLFSPGYNRTFTLSLLISLVIITSSTGIITGIEEHRSGGRALKRYLRAVANDNSDLKPVGFAQQSALISVSVPLKDIFIHLHATTDRPRFDLPAEQLKLLEELRRRADLVPDQREDEIQKLRVIWHSQMGQNLFEAPRNIDVEYVMKQLTARQPGAIMLGAPGSGKSTTMRWLAYHMARAGRLPSWRRGLNALLGPLNSVTHRQFTLGYALPKELAPVQFPILLRISDYAKVLYKSENAQQPFQQFFMEHFVQRYPEQPKLAERLLNELQVGHCLLLLDGLDEVANDELRRIVAENIATFVARYAPENPKARHFNRFVVTSRIVGYEAGRFANYAHYTLQDLEDEQIWQFLTNWCPTVERHQKMLAQSMKSLTPLQRVQANKEGREQKVRLWEALQYSPGIKRLAVNPLMLTILALIQRSGRTLPHRRIELYQIATRTLLDNWNQETGRRVFPVEELPLAEDMLSRLAYEMHNSDRLLTDAKVNEIASEAMHDFYRQEKPIEQAIKRFLDTLGNSSGLFAEAGQGLFSFMHRTIQEYFAAQYLLHLPFAEQEQAVRKYSNKATWHEALLLLIAYKSMQSNRDEKQQASILIQAIAEDSDDYDEFLQRNLLLAANCIVDCGAWAVQHDLQRRIAYQIFDIYGDVLGAGRYVALQEDIERIVLLWLRGQPLESDNARPPFLDAWYIALCDTTQPVRQEGAAHLLATLASDLRGCPAPVLSILLPPLLQLADVVEMACPPEYIRKQLPQPAVRPAMSQVTEYALVALRLFEEDGPAGWLHKEWVQWHKEKPKLLERLTRHSLELGYLLTPVAIPEKPYDPNWYKLFAISKEWKQYARSNARNLQMRLLEVSTTARFPQAWLFKKLLLREEAFAQQNIPWRRIWDSVLHAEMALGKSATYQTSLHLRLLLYKNNKQRLQEIAIELQNTLSLWDQKQELALHAIIYTHISNLPEARYLRHISEIRYYRYFLDFRDFRYIPDHLNFRYPLNTVNFSSSVKTPFPLYLRGYRGFMEASFLQDFRNTHAFITFLDYPFIRYIRVLIRIKKIADLNYIGKILNLRYIEEIPFLREFPDTPDLLDLLKTLKLLDYTIIINKLCAALEQKNAPISTILFCIYSIIANDDILAEQYKPQLLDSLQKLASSTPLHILTLEQCLLIEVINRVLGTVAITSSAVTQPPTQHMADERAKQIAALKQQSNLKKEDAEELLVACTDTRTTEKETWQELTGKDATEYGRWAGTVGIFAWEQISQTWNLDMDARKVVINALNDVDAIICAAAALLLQQSKHYFTENERKIAAQNIIAILRDEELSRRPLDPPDNSYKIWRLDDVLFETLRVLAE